MPAFGRPILVVLAGSFNEFRAWCRDSGLRTDDPEVVYADGLRRLRGISHAKVIRCPRWYNHPEVGHMDEWARLMEQRSSAPNPNA